MPTTLDPKVKKEISRVRSEIRKQAQQLEQIKKSKSELNAFTGLTSGNYWTATGMPWVSSEGRKAVLTEWFWQPVRGQPRRVDTNELRQFAQTFWVNSCVKTVLDQIRSVKWDIVPDDDYDYEQVKAGIEYCKTFLKYPNKNLESFMDVVLAAYKDVLELDAGCLIKTFDIESYDWETLEASSGSPILKPVGERNLVEIYARDGASFLKDADKFGYVKGFWQYSYQIPAQPMWFNRDEVSYLMEQERSMSCYGYSAVQSVLDIVKSLHYSTLYNKKYFEESSIPEGILGLEDTNELEGQAFLKYWNTDFKAQPHKIAIVNKKVNWQPFNITNKELEFLETQKAYFSFVISSFGLTPTELGITADVNRATGNNQTEVSRRKSLFPRLQLIEERINKDILPEFGFEGIKFTFIIDDPAQQAQKLNNWKLELDMGITTVNEIRNEEGKDPVEWGDQPKGMMQAQAGFGQPGVPPPKSGNNPAEDNGAQTDKEEGKDAEEQNKKEEGKPFPTKKGVSYNPESLRSGQFYNEQTISHNAHGPAQQSGPTASWSPQGSPVPTPQHQGPSRDVQDATGRSLNNQFQNSMKCPACGFNALFQTNGADDFNSVQSFRCQSCGSSFTKQELIDWDVLRRFQQTLMANPHDSREAQGARWSPKALTEPRETSVLKSGLDSTSQKVLIGPLTTSFQQPTPQSLTTFSAKSLARKNAHKFSKHYQPASVSVKA